MQRTLCETREKSEKIARQRGGASRGPCRKKPERIGEVWELRFRGRLFKEGDGLKEKEDDRLDISYRESSGRCYLSLFG